MIAITYEQLDLSFGDWFRSLGHEQMTEDELARRAFIAGAQAAALQILCMLEGGRVEGEVH